MIVGLIDVDSHNYPNLALMKISSYHKALGDDVEMFMPIKKYDRVYMSKIFTFTPDYEGIIQADEIIKGGTGYDINTKLPPEIEKVYPDYDLYGITDKAYGYLTRGCPRNCEFCIVGQKEGLKSYKVSDLKDFWRGQKEIILNDPNFLACPNWKELLQQLIDSKAFIEFNQGLDIRFMTPEKAEMISRLKVKTLHFAWDNYEFSTYGKLKEYRPQLKFNRRKLMVYVLVNFNTTIEQDLERVYKLRELDYDPYIMIFEKEKLPRGHIKRKMQRWVNNKFVFNVVNTFEEYQKK